MRLGALPTLSLSPRLHCASYPTHYICHAFVIAAIGRNSSARFVLWSGRQCLNASILAWYATPHLLLPLRQPHGLRPQRCPHFQGAKACEDFVAKFSTCADDQWRIFMSARSTPPPASI